MCLPSVEWRQSLPFIIETHSKHELRANVIGQMLLFCNVFAKTKFKEGPNMKVHCCRLFVATGTMIKMDKGAGDRY